MKGKIPMKLQLKIKAKGGARGHQTARFTIMELGPKKSQRWGWG